MTENNGIIAWFKRVLPVFLLCGMILLAVAARQRIELPTEEGGIVVSATTLEKYMEQYLESRWMNIDLNIRFTEEETALVHALLPSTQLHELLDVPDWISAVLPDKLEVDICIRPSINTQGTVELAADALTINGQTMPQPIGDAACAGLAHKINEILLENKLSIRTLQISEGSLRIETKPQKR